MFVTACAVVSMAFFVAFLSSSPMHEPNEENAARIGSDEWVGAVIELPGPHGLRVRRSDDGVFISTADGGGAGEVVFSSRGCEREQSMRIVRERFRDRLSFAAYACGERQVVHFDEEGVRLDDEPSDRWRAALSLR
jgi:hypothetical protein